MPTLHVVQAFDASEDGEIGPAGDAEMFETADRAIRTAKALAARHAGVIAWSREADPDNGDYGPPIVLFQAGQVPEDME